MAEFDGHSRRCFFSMAFGALTLPLTLPLLAMEKSPNSSTQFVRSGLWQRVNGTGLERFELLRGPGSWTLKGTILTLGDRGPAEVVYELLCDAVWRTRHGFFLLRDQSGDRFLRVIADNGRWFENGQKRKDLADCIDIDLGWSPSSNTLPIRRLGLKVGARSGQLVMAWIRFPELTIERLQQQYERVSERRYMYTSRGGSFKARIDVDEEELVLDYEGAWLRVG